MRWCISVHCQVFSFNTLFYVALTSEDFVNVPPTRSLDSLHKMVVENGGMFSMNLNNSVTHCIAAESKGLCLSLVLSHTQKWQKECRHKLFYAKEFLFGNFNEE